jgi:hypothetical protein
VRSRSKSKFFKKPEPQKIVSNSGFEVPYLYSILTMNYIFNLKPVPFFSFRNIHFTVNNSECVARSTVIVLAVKPHLYGEVLSAMAAESSVSSDPLDTSSGRLWISIMAGVTISDLRAAISTVDPECRVVRTIPNTTMKVRDGYW